MKNLAGEEFAIGAYIEAAEKFRFINTIDELVLEMVVQEFVEFSEIRLSINVSAYAVSNIAWMKKAKNLLQNKAIASRLIIEITETIAHKNLNKSIKFIENLQAMGCRISLDDFGTGYTSFSKLKILPIDMVKIDGLFIKDIITNYNNEFFVKSVVELNKALNRLVVAEFVETKEIAHKLEALGVDELQGYAFGMPRATPYWREINTSSVD
jgi:EAL domain-containing protein (putative c-di-GMP-specific phosphodiesterase class I)